MTCMERALGPETWLVLAGPSDEATILPLARAFHAEDGHPLRERGEQALRRLLADSALGLVFKVARPDRVVGYAALCFGYAIEWGGRDAFVDDLYLEPGARGRGLGRRVVQELVVVARDAGCVALHLEVMRGNRADGLYRRLGFQDRGSTFLTRPINE
jgi:GNAT superfamily N-acetyltransferase